MIVVSDTSCVSNLISVNHLDLLHKIYNEIYLPPAVYNEILQLREDIKLEIASHDWIRVEEDFEKNISLSPPKYVDPGEAEAIDLALYLKADRLLIDERKGTLLANKLGLTTIGLLGIFKIAKENNLVPSAKNLVDKLIENNFWLSNSLYQQFLKSVNEL